MISTPYYNIVQLTPDGWVIDLTIGEDVDTSAFGDITHTLVEAWPVDRTAKHVVIDLAHNRYMGSMLLGLLVNLRHKAKSAGAEAIFVSVPQRLLASIRLTNLDRMLKFAPSRDDVVGRW